MRLVCDLHGIDRGRRLILIDEALRRRHEEGRPLRVGLVGAGFMAKGLIRQIGGSVPGMRIVGVSNRTPERGRDALRKAGEPEPRFVSTAADAEAAVAAGHTFVTDDPRVVCGCASVDVMVEATGAVDFGARVTLAAIEAGKPLVSMNAELDATVGSWLHHEARRAGVALSGCDGDQPGAQMNLLRFVRGMGLTPLVAGNVKGLEDPYRTPETQRSYARAWGQSPTMVTSFADGTKIRFEQVLVANATGMSVPEEGLLGFEHDGHVDDLPAIYEERYGIDRLRQAGGVVDYVVGARPSPGVYVVAANDDPAREIYLRYGKLGDGPLYSFYVPYHLTILEVPISIARVALFDDRVIAPREDAPMADVVARAKRDLQEGEMVDGIGGFTVYGGCQDYARVMSDGLLPIGLSEGCRLRRAVAKDAYLHYGDVELPEGTLVHDLRRRQDALYPA